MITLTDREYDSLLGEIGQLKARVAELEREIVILEGQLEFAHYQPDEL